MKKAFNIGNKALCLFVFALVLTGVVFASGGTQSSGGQVTELRTLLRAGQGNLGDTEAHPTLGYINKVTGINLIADQLPVDQGMEKLNAVMAAGGQEYDYIAIPWMERYAFYATSGALLDMGAIWKNYPNISTIPRDSIEMVMVNNTWYCVPNFQPWVPPNSTNTNAAIIWRSDTLEKMGAQLPTTIDQFTALLQRYKDTDPLGNGAANAPLVGNLQQMRINGIGGAFGVAVNWIDRNGTLIPYQTQDGFFEFINYMHDLYVKGLLDRETPTNNDAAINQKFTTGRALAATRTWGNVIALVSTFQIADARERMAYSQPLSRNGVSGLRAGPKGLLDYVIVFPGTTGTGR